MRKIVLAIVCGLMLAFACSSVALAQSRSPEVTVKNGPGAGNAAI